MKSYRNLRPELALKVQNWLVSFHRLDPRYKILTFFNQVGAEGADNLMDVASDDANYPTNAVDGEEAHRPSVLSPVQ